MVELTSTWEKTPIREEKGKKTFSSDDLIDAYLKGKKAQADQDNQMRLEKLEYNLKKAMELSEGMFSAIKSSGFSCDQVRLKIKDIYHFSSVFIVGEDDFCDDKFLEIYEKSIELKKKANKSGTFDFTTIFTPKNEELEEKSLIADGYIFNYGLQ